MTKSDGKTKTSKVDKSKWLPTSAPLRMKPIAQVRAEYEELENEIKNFRSLAYCYMCDAFKKREYFYKNTDVMQKSGVTPICKECARKIALRVDKQGMVHEPTRESVAKALFYLNKPYLQAVWDASVQEVEAIKMDKSVRYNVWTAYVKNIAMPQYATLTYLDSDIFKSKSQDEVVADMTVGELIKPAETSVDIEGDYRKNREDVIRLLGYDPFAGEAITDQPFLYSQLVGLLDQGGDTNDDYSRVFACVEIVRLFLQSKKISDEISRLSSQPGLLINNAGTIKSLQDTKSKIIGSISILAKDNCISLQYNKGTKKGENTWTGKVKKVADLNLREAEINGFDINTCRGMQQVADISVAAMLKQLALDDADYSDIVAQQLERIHKLNRETEYAKEVARILLRENIDLKDFIGEQNLKIPFPVADLNKLILDVDLPAQTPESDREGEEVEYTLPGMRTESDEEDKPKDEGRPYTPDDIDLPSTGEDISADGDHDE